MRTAEHIVIGLVLTAALAVVGCNVDQDACLRAATPEGTTTAAGGATMTDETSGTTGATGGTSTTGVTGGASVDQSAGGVSGGLSTGTTSIDPCVVLTGTATGTGAGGATTGM
jgi:hypothetical protein